ncbi:MAG: glucokinase, partial [Alphaproteobacteria bacterium]|nr:glucokinase [Alphaproteobacteria bacterium]
MNKVLVGDVGGTHARFAVVEIAGDTAKIGAQVVLDDAFPAFADALKAGIGKLGEKPDAAAIAVAGPVSDGRARFTNRGWSASEEEIRALGFAHALLVNDFAALAFAAGHIPANELKTIGPELAGLAGEPVSILGAGTGFGVSALARWKGRAAPLATEGGHIGFAPSNARERALLDVLAARFPRVSIERLLSGPGILNIYSGLGEIEGKPAQAADAAEVQKR